MMNLIGFIVLLVGLNNVLARGMERVMGGTPVNITEVPYFARWNIRYKDNSGAEMEILCGASIVHPRYLISAAHCVPDPNEVAIKRENIVTVGTDENGDGSGQVYEVQRIYQHPRYNNITSDYDIAIIELKRELNFDNRVGTIQMAKANLVVKPGDIVKSMGFGSTNCKEPNSDSKQLLEVYLPIAKRESCLFKLTDRMICAGGIPKAGSCQGDSGGPLVYGDVLLGVVSHGKIRRTSAVVYTSIPAMRSFIDSIIPAN